ncbi:MAG TPA: ComF family protein [Usitatibacter sp.]|nr:ComF family protein [Usitatibacter sp.]
MKISSMILAQDCALCGGRSDSELVCPECRDALPRIARACARCAIPLATKAMFCGECARPARHRFDDALAVFEYRFPVDRLVQRFKYAGDLAMGRWLAERLAAAAANRERPDLVVATPLANRSLRERGFNQALVLARHVCAALALPCELAAVSKERETPKQEGLGRRQRVENLRDAFRCELRLSGEHVALVDDVVTTGATASALARVLRERGAGRVSVWAVARTPDPALR